MHDIEMLEVMKCASRQAIRGAVKIALKSKKLVKGGTQGRGRYKASTDFMYSQGAPGMCHFPVSYRLMHEQTQFILGKEFTELPYMNAPIAIPANKMKQWPHIN